MGLEVVVKLAPCEHHRVEQLLDLRVMRLGLRQHLADVVNRALDWQGVALLRTFHHDDGADHLSGCGDVEVQRFTVLGWCEDGRMGERRLELVKCLLGLDGPGETLVLFQESVEGKPLFAEPRDEAAQGGKTP
jgi:hypothetical protein